MSNPKSLLQYAVGRLGAQDLSNLLERSGLRFLIAGQWYRFVEGALRSETTGSPSASADVRSVELVAGQFVPEGDNMDRDRPTSIKSTPVGQGVKERAGGSTIPDGNARGQGAAPIPGTTTVGQDNLVTSEQSRSTGAVDPAEQQAAREMASGETTAQRQGAVAEHGKAAGSQAAAHNQGGAAPGQGTPATGHPGSHGHNQPPTSGTPGGTPKP